MANKSLDSVVALLPKDEPLGPNELKPIQETFGKKVYGFKHKSTWYQHPYRNANGTLKPLTETEKKRARYTPMVGD